MGCKVIKISKRFYYFFLKSFSGKFLQLDDLTFSFLKPIHFFLTFARRFSALPL